MKTSWNPHIWLENIFPVKSHNGAGLQIYLYLYLYHSLSLAISVSILIYLRGS